jgi:O-methyltransferase involved in polyketide biosynthesis
MNCNKANKMESRKEKIQLTAEQETLLITLLAKADPNNPVFYDPKTREIMERIDYDFSKLRVPYKTVILVGQRAKKMDDTVRVFLREHTDGVVLHLGCGLDSRFWRVDNGKTRWYDLDLPPVIALRKKFYESHDRYTLIASSVTDLTWIKGIHAGGSSVLVVAEGLLMYLEEADVRALFLTLQRAFPGCRLVADAFSTLAAKSASRHASLRKTGASIYWGVDDPSELEGWSEGIGLIEEWYFSQDSSVEKLSWGYRLGYKFASLFKVANRAHRILYFQL